MKIFIMNNVWYVRITVEMLKETKKGVELEGLKIIEMPSNTLDINVFRNQWHKIEYISNELYGCKYEKLPKSKRFKIQKLEKIKELRNGR